MSGWAQSAAEEAEDAHAFEQKERRRQNAIGTELAKQPHVLLSQLGCCSSLTIVNFGEPGQHVVYCEEYVAPGFAHVGHHKGVAGVDIPGRHPVEWAWSERFP